jgi:hypothetical protein
MDAAGGLDAVAHHLATLDLAGYDAKRPPRKTEAFHEIVSLSAAPEDEELAEVLGNLDWPDAVTFNEVMEKAAKTEISSSTST